MGCQVGQICLTKLLQTADKLFFTTRCPYSVAVGFILVFPRKNIEHYRNQEVDRLIETLRYTLDEKKQIELYHKIHRIIYSDQPYCFLWSRKRLVAYSARLMGVRFYSTIWPGSDEREWSTVPGMERVK